MEANTYNLGIYRLREHVGSGGAHNVYRAEDEDSGNDVAIKIYVDHDDRKENNDQTFKEMEEEWKVSQQFLNNPRILTIRDIVDTKTDREIQIPVILRQVFYCAEDSVHPLDECKKTAPDRHGNQKSTQLSSDKDRIVYLVCDYFPIGNLGNELTTKLPLKEKDAVNHLLKVMHCLSVLHDAPENYVHRDIKPENILLGLKDTLKMSDFGW